MPLQPGQTLNGRYFIVRQLGRGGMGAVYLAEDLNLGRKQVALKENLDLSKAAQEQFTAEAMILARLSHPSLPQVTDHFTVASGAQYLVMQYIEGEDLDRILGRRRPLPEAEVLDWMAQVLDALQYMHTWIDPTTGLVTPVLHRDIKPGNIKRMSTGRIVLVDFGIAKYQQPGGTLPGARACTPGFAPLEQYSGGTDMRSDVYSIGATLYCLLTGQIPPEAPDLAAGRKPLPPPRSVVSTISPSVEAVILRAMRPLMIDRYQTIAELCADLSPDLWQVCQTCRALNRAGARFCLNCGTPLTRQPITPLQPGPQGQVAPPPLIPVTPMPGAPHVVSPVASPPPVRLPAVATRRLPLGSGLQLEFVLVPQGEFVMGSNTDLDNEAQADEEPEHKVFLPDYWIGKHPVTVAQFAEFVRVTGYITTAERDRKSCDWQHPLGPHTDVAAKQNHPVTQVSWEDATAFCTWAAKATGEKIVLPTEAEWEKAARGEQAQPYPWGAAPASDTLLNYDKKVSDTTPIDRYPAGASPYGALDMAGNVWEWVNDRYGNRYYDESPNKSPLGPQAGNFRVRRGGGWSNSARSCRAAFRSNNFATHSDRDVGFRCAISPGR